MDKDQKFGITICFLVAIVLITLIGSITWYNAYTTNVYVTNGYSPTSLPGLSEAQWVKQ
jgi:hypothetical protein